MCVSLAHILCTLTTITPLVFTTVTPSQIVVTFPAVQAVITL